MVSDDDSVMKTDTNYKQVTSTLASSSTRTSLVSILRARSWSSRSLYPRAQILCKGR
jgi:hypothetical protein